MAFDAGAVKARMVLDKSKWHKSAQEVNDMKKKMAGQAKKTGTAFKGMWKQMAIGIGITGGITMVMRGLTRQISDTVKVGRDFEREWANVTTMLNISRTATEKMKHELRMLSPTLGDTTELAKGMYQVLSASIEPAKAIRFLGEAAKSAKAGVTETKVAVDAMTTVINAYGMAAEAAGEVSDIMFGIVKRGKVTYDELAHSLGTVIPIAATVGVGFRDVGAAIATLTRQGVQASKATMQLRQVMMLILGPSAEAMEIMDDLEISYGKNALEAQGLAGWLEELKEKTKGNVDIMRKIVPNARALTATLALVGKAAKGYAYDQEFMAETMGFTDEAFIKQTESIDFWLKTLDVATGKIKIAIYEGLVASLRESIRTAEDFDEKITKATNDAANAVSLHVNTMVNVMTWFRKALKDANFAFEKFIGAVPKGVERIDELTEAELKLRDAMLRGVPEGAIEDIDRFKEANEYLKIVLLDLGEDTEDLGDKWGRLTSEIKESAKKIASLVKEMTDDIMGATLNEFEYRKWAAQQTYEERKALLEAEHADREAFVLLEKSLAAELDQIEKDRTQTTQEEAEKRASILRTILDKMATIERAHRGEVRSIVLASADIEKQLTMNKLDYERDKLNEKYAADLIAAEGNSEAMLQIIRAYQLQKEEIDKEMAASFEHIFSVMAGAVGNFFIQIGNLSQVNLDNQMIALNEETNANQNALDERYETEKEAIENSLMSEEEKAEALEKLEEEKIKAQEKLDEEYEGRKKKIQKEAFESYKKISLKIAAIDISAAVIEALPNFILAGLVGLAGAAQVTAINAQTFPSAEKGAYLPSPTIIEAGHGPMGEVILPLDKAPISGLGATVSFNFYAPIITAISLTDRDMDEAAEYLLEKVKDEFGRYGGKLNA